MKNQYFGKFPNIPFYLTPFYGNVYNKSKNKQNVFCGKVGSILPISTVYRTTKMLCCERYTIMQVTTIGLPHILCNGIVLYVYSSISMAGN